MINLNAKAMGFYNLYCLAGVLFTNYFANALPINNISTGQVSAKFPNMFTPSGFTFSIWGVIYILLIVFSFNQFTDSRKEWDRHHLLAVGPWFAISCFANIFWIICWHYLYIKLSLVMMAALLLSLIKIYLSLLPLRDDVFIFRKVSFYISFSVYLGWICVASIANFTVVLVDAGWNGYGLSDQFWTILMISAAALLAIIFLYKYSDIYFALVILWSLFGILSKRLSGNYSELMTLIYFLCSYMALIASGVLYKIFRKEIY